ncbi:MAG TPA: hypothetical protein VLC28_15395 [Flavitalea sp.]|nr:hypothetical protein [Flavitalea sp.]
MKSFAGIVFITTIVTGLFTWFSSNHNHNNDIAMTLLLSILFALACDMLTNFDNGKIVFATATGITLALVVKILIDWQFDPTSHNLFPFEIVINFIAASVASLVGIGCGYVYRRIRRR